MGTAHFTSDKTQVNVIITSQLQEKTRENTYTLNHTCTKICNKMSECLDCLAFK